MLSYYAKAVIAFLTPAAVILIAALPNISQDEWLLAAFAAIATAGGVAVKKNGPKPAKNEAGIVTSELCLIVIAVCSVVIVLLGTGLVDNGNDHDGKKGLDWEKVPSLSA